MEQDLNHRGEHVSGVHRTIVPLSTWISSVNITHLLVRLLRVCGADNKYREGEVKALWVKFPYLEFCTTSFSLPSHESTGARRICEYFLQSYMLRSLSSVLVPMALGY